MTESPGLAARRTAWKAVRRVHEQDAWASPAVDAALRASGLDARDRSLAAHLAFEVLRWEGTLDWALQQVVARPLSAVEPRLLDVLRLGAQELLHGHAPDHAVTATAVDLAANVVGRRATGFTNGVLRGLARQRDTLPWPDPATPEGLGVQLGYPAWIAREAFARFGERAAAVLAAGNVSPGTTLRVVGEVEAVADELRAAGLDPRPGALAPRALRVPGAVPRELASVVEGRAVVQDEASIVVGGAALAGMPAGALAVDACAGPGGKSTHLASAGLRVVALERQPARAALVAEAAARTGTEVLVVAADATAPPLRPGTADLVLVDAPCTGLGTVRRRPELRWRRSEDEVAALAHLQVRLLESAAALLKPGGRLVYSVCTWTVAETDSVVDRIEERLGGAFQPDPLGFPGSDAARHRVQLDPDAHGTDGMYVASLRRGPARSA